MKNLIGGSNFKKQNNLIAFLIFLVLSLILTFAIELIQKNGFMNAFNWCISSPQILLTNWILILFCMSLIYSVCGCIYISGSISYFVLLILSLASYYKGKFLGEPLFPWDLTLKREGINIFPLLQQEMGFIILFVIVIASVIIFLLRFFLPKLKIGYVQRILGGLFAFLILLTISINSVSLQNAMSNAGMGEITWNQDENYNRNGMVLSFLRNFKNAVISKPSGYSEKNVLAALNEKGIDESDTPKSVENPNIIFVMSEAFWDPTIIDTISFSSDPIPTFHKIQKEHTSGWLLSPEFGGLTANVEFEVLTGNSMSFLPTGSVPYQQFIKGPLLSLAGILKAQGYASVAVHSYLGWFWNRNSVYQNMGFEKFISSENMKNPKYKGLYISDNEVTKEIINQIKGNKNPVFIYAITMQNHGPYDKKRYKENEIKVTGDVSENTKSMLETYAQGISDADKSLKTLVEDIYSSEEPTMVVFFGDHLPFLGYDYSAYTETGYISSGKQKDWGLEDYRKMRRVPVVIWSNYEQKKQEIKDMSDSFLGLYVLKMAGKELPTYFKFIDKVYKSLPGFLKELKIDSAGNLHHGDDNNYKKIMDEYWMLEYDRLFGSKIQEK